MRVEASGATPGFYGQRMRVSRKRDDGHDNRRNRHAPMEPNRWERGGRIQSLRQRRERLFRQRPRLTQCPSAPARSLPTRFRRISSARTADTFVDVFGPVWLCQNTNKALLKKTRRVAVVGIPRQAGWSSDMAAAPRPLIYSAPVSTGRAGAPFPIRCEPSALSAISRTNEPVSQSFWGTSKSRHLPLVQAPAGLVVLIPRRA